MRVRSRQVAASIAPSLKVCRRDAVGVLVKYGTENPGKDTPCVEAPALPGPKRVRVVSRLPFAQTSFLHSSRLRAELSRGLHGARDGRHGRSAHSCSHGDDSMRDRVRRRGRCRPPSRPRCSWPPRRQNLGHNARASKRTRNPAPRRRGPPPSRRIAHASCGSGSDRANALW